MPTLRLLPEFEDDLRRLPGVIAVSVVTGPTAVPTEIHVLAEPGKAPKQIVRDVQSLALVQHGLDIDHRIVSVVQIGSEEVAGAVPQPATPVRPPAPAPPVQPPAINGSDPRDEPTGTASTPEPSVVDLGDADVDEVGSRQPLRAPEPLLRSVGVSRRPLRPAITSITVRTSGGDAEALVTVLGDGELFEGRAVGSNHISQRVRLVAQATLDAVGELLGAQAAVESASVVRAGQRPVALVVLAVDVPRLGEQQVSGSALVRGDEVDAVARAVLDALNRRLAG